MFQQSRRHYRRPYERPFTYDEKNRVTILFGGLTERHNFLLRAAGRSLGYKVDFVPTPTKQDYQTGREYADNGMCSPLYFTLGSLINHLRRLQKENGLSPAEVIDQYVYVIAGSRGPCRFGMYEAQFRLALRNSGFDGFRILTFEQKKLNQPTQHSGLVFNGTVFLPLFVAVMLADILNEMANQWRPYEVIEGQTDLVLDEVTNRIAGFLEKPITPNKRTSLIAYVFSSFFPGASPEEMQKVIHVLIGRELHHLLRECAQHLNNRLQVDYLRPKPVCKITGEFWAQTTEGDGNFRMFSYLESLGAEVIVEPLTMWFLYLACLAWNRVYDEHGLPPCGILKRICSLPETFMKALRFRIAVTLVNFAYNRFRRALGDIALYQPDQFELQRMAEKYYNRKCKGGEGYLEIAKTIYYLQNRLAHLVISLKPFGCLPSTQSDGAQAAVLADYPDIHFLPIETSGEGDVNAHSRVQMALTDVKEKARREFQDCLQRWNLSLDEIRRYLETHPEWQRPLTKIPKYKGITGRGARFVTFVAKKMRVDLSYRLTTIKNKTECTE